ncbi:endonuclease MutS2 [Segatella hominis]|uniref:endonuclease MutS2 n=1 Tax=Segatella hominis TaxID=2518605 RepID=UPI003F7D88A3
MIYPDNFEQKIGFNEIRTMLRERCLSTLGKEQVEKMGFSDHAETVNEWLMQVREFRQLISEVEDFPLQYFYDVRESIVRIRIENTHLEENELFDLRRSLSTIESIVKILNHSDEDDSHAEENDGWRREKIYTYPALHRLAKDVITFPQIIQRIDQILDKYGKIRDNATPELLQIRRELAKTEGSISRTLYSILRSAQSEGVVEKDVTPTLRDGRLVIPVIPTLKKKIKGIVHDESATGKTVFIEPTEVVEANNRVRELEGEERKEIIRILTNFTNKVRPYVREMMDSYRFLAKIDLIQAKAKIAEIFKAIEPEVEDHPHIDWIRAIHPLLQISLEKKGEKVVPLDIILTQGKRILIISGPNAGGKSVCLKTVGLLQYMLQCGLSIPVSERSKTGVFQNIMIDIGDEQSLENDLSTYSSHLLNMKNMMRAANNSTIILIDEFGTGTEPGIGGAIAEAVLDKFCKQQAYGVITTHYQNLKHFADSHEGVANGAMLYDRHEMKALFQLAIGRPGSSFAIEIARKIGLPEEVIKEASDIVGSEYIQSDKYLQDIVRDKRYWENKRQSIHQREKDMEKTISKYESDIEEIEKSRKQILAKAKQQAEELLKESNKKIENAIREIRENQAEKEETKRIRQELDAFKQEMQEIDTKDNDDKIARKIAQIQQRKERHAKRKAEKAQNQEKAAAALRNAQNKSQAESNKELKEGDTVRIKGLTTVGKIESISGDMATAVFGGMKTKMRLSRLEHATASTEKDKTEERKENLASYGISKETRKTIDAHKSNFHQDLDVRGMRGDEALNAVQHFIDDAILVGMPRVRILHGKGNGILRQLIRQYVSSIPNVVHYADEHVQFGGAGITVVDF